MLSRHKAIVAFLTFLLAPVFAAGAITTLPGALAFVPVFPIVAMAWFFSLPRSVWVLVVLLGAAWTDSYLLLFPASTLMQALGLIAAATLAARALSTQSLASETAIALAGLGGYLVVAVMSQRLLVRYDVFAGTVPSFTAIAIAGLVLYGVVLVRRRMSPSGAYLRGSYLQ